MPLKPEGKKTLIPDQKPEGASIVFSQTTPRYTFEDMILAETTIDELRTVVSAQKNWNKVFQEWGLVTVLKERKNLFINLYGDSGTGKTMAAHAIASELGKN